MGTNWINRHLAGMPAKPPSPHHPDGLISISVGLPHIPLHKRQTEKPQVRGGSKKLLSTDKGSPKIPRCDKQSERTNTIEAQYSAREFMLSLVGLSSKEYCKYAHIFCLSLTRTHFRVCKHKGLNSSLRLSLKVKLQRNTLRIRVYY